MRAPCGRRAHPCSIDDPPRLSRGVLTLLASPLTSTPAGGSLLAARGLDATALAVDREADRRADRGDDPEAQDDLRLRPGLQLEVVVDRGHQEDAFSER